jgi:polyisoprenyl-teichoic acid--peptidoglycan teichoic acid transferase
MDNFRRYRKHSSSSNTDGFVRSGSGRQVGRVPDLKRGNAYKSERPRIGDFKSSDGFHPIARSTQTIGQPEKPLPHGGHSGANRQPARSNSGDIQLAHYDTGMSHEEPVKKKRFGRRKHQAAHTKKKRFRRTRELFFFNPFKKSNWTKKRAAANAFLMVVLVVTFFGARAWWLANQVFQGGGGAVALQEDVDPSLLRGEGDGRVNLLLLGRGGEGHEGPDLTDTLLIASINPIQKEAALLSIPRDLYVKTSSGGYSKINAVFANAKYSALANSSSADPSRVQKAENAGFKAVEDVIAARIGIPIHYHGIIDFAGFAKAINTVGGVNVNVPETGAVYENMWIMGQNYTLNVKKGPTHFNGLKALAYSRSRYTSARGDFDRSERQRMILVALKDKVLSAGTYSNPVKINQLMSDFGKHIRTNLSLNEVKRLYDIGSQIPSNKIASVGLADPPNNYLTTSFIDGQSVVIPRAGLDNYKEIQHFVRNRLRDGFLAKENAIVGIYNGTNIAGLATRTSEDLKSYGYNITKVGDSPTKGNQKTIVVDLSNGQKKYTRRYLENRFKTTVVKSMPSGSKINPGNADFVIILGQNEQTRLAN